MNASMFPEKMSRASVLCSAPKRWREQLQMEDAVGAVAEMSVKASQIIHQLWRDAKKPS